MKPHLPWIRKLKKLYKGHPDISAERTCLIIAHRLSTIISAHEILVLDKGVIIQKGTHEDLLQTGGKYTELWRIKVKRNPKYWYNAYLKLSQNMNIKKDPRDFLLNCFNIAIESANPIKSLRNFLPSPLRVVYLLLGAGKAAAMAKAVRSNGPQELTYLGWL